MLSLHKTEYLSFTRSPCFNLDGGQLRSVIIIAPGPGVAEPECGKQVKWRRLRSTVGGAHADQHVEWVNFGVFHGDIEVAVFSKDAGVNQLIFGFLPAPIAIRGDKIGIRESALWVF